MNVCPICYEDLENDKLCYITTCNHSFHKKCLFEWLKHNNSCPMCRSTEFIQNMIYYINKKNNRDYKFKFNFGSRIKTITINDKIFTDSYKKLINQPPQAWIDCLKQKNLAPIYSIKDINNESIYIDFYLRQIILFDKLDYNKIEEKKGFDSDGNETVYYTSKQFIKNNNLIISRNIYEIMVDWIYELIKGGIIKKYKIFYSININSLILDLITLTIKKFEMKNIFYQTAIISSIYSSFKFLQNEEIDKDYLIWSTNNSSSLEKMNEFITYQEKILKYVEKY